eukprot:2127203-Rhodomonas_salina.1
MENPRHLPGSYIFFDPSAAENKYGKENANNINGFGNDIVNQPLQKKIAKIDLEEGFCFVSADIVEFGVANRQMEVV